MLRRVPSFASVASLVALSVALGGGTFAVAQSDPVAEISVPPGTVSPYAGSSAPPGWIVADGSEANRLQYPDLFAAIGTTYGAGNGTTTFNVPDLRGRVVVGRGTNADVDSLSDNDGLAASARKARHRHGKGSLAIGSSGSHFHYMSNTPYVYGVPGNHYEQPTQAEGNEQYRTNTGGAHGHPSSSFTGEAGDTGGPLDSPAHQVLNYIVKH